MQRPGTLKISAYETSKRSSLKSLNFGQHNLIQNINSSLINGSIRQITAQSPEPRYNSKSVRQDSDPFKVKSALLANKYKNSKFIHRNAGTPSESSVHSSQRLPLPVPLEMPVDTTELDLEIELMRTSFLKRQNVAEVNVNQQTLINFKDKKPKTSVVSSKKCNKFTELFDTSIKHNVPPKLHRMTQEELRWEQNAPSDRTTSTWTKLLRVNQENKVKPSIVQTGKKGGIFQDLLQDLMRNKAKLQVDVHAVNASRITQVQSGVSMTQFSGNLDCQAVAKRLIQGSRYENSTQMSLRDYHTLTSQQEQRKQRICHTSLDIHLPIAMHITQETFLSDQSRNFLSSNFHPRPKTSKSIKSHGCNLSEILSSLLEKQSSVLTHKTSSITPSRSQILGLNNKTRNSSEFRLSNRINKSRDRIKVFQTIQ